MEKSVKSKMIKKKKLFDTIDVLNIFRIHPVTKKVYIQTLTEELEIGDLSHLLTNLKELKSLENTSNIQNQCNHEYYDSVSVQLRAGDEISAHTYTCKKCGTIKIRS